MQTEQLIARLGDCIMGQFLLWVLGYSWQINQKQTSNESSLVNITQVLLRKIICCPGGDINEKRMQKSVVFMCSVC